MQGYFDYTWNVMVIIVVLLCSEWKNVDSYFRGKNLKKKNEYGYQEEY